jgi:hypothetical protein
MWLASSSPVKAFIRPAENFGPERNAFPGIAQNTIYSS